MFKNAIEILPPEDKLVVTPPKAGKKKKERKFRVYPQTQQLTKREQQILEIVGTHPPNEARLVEKLRLAPEEEVEETWKAMTGLALSAKLVAEVLRLEPVIQALPQGQYKRHWSSLVYGEGFGYIEGVKTPHDLAAFIEGLTEVVEYRKLSKPNTCLLILANEYAREGEDHEHLEELIKLGEVPSSPRIFADTVLFSTLEKEGLDKQVKYRRLGPQGPQPVLVGQPRPTHLVSFVIHQHQGLLAWKPGLFREQVVGEERHLWVTVLPE